MRDRPICFDRRAVGWTERRRSPRRAEALLKSAFTAELCRPMRGWRKSCDNRGPRLTSGNSAYCGHARCVFFLVNARVCLVLRRHRSDTNCTRTKTVFQCFYTRRLSMLNCEFDEYLTLFKNEFSLNF